MAWVSPFAIPANAADASAPNPTQLVTAFDVANQTANATGLAPLLAHDVVWVYHAPEHEVSFGGTRVGLAGVSEFFALRDRELINHEWKSKDVLTSGDVVTILGTERADVKRTGGRYVANSAVMLTVRQGKIEKVEEFVDSSAIVDAFSTADPARGRAIFNMCTGCHGSGVQGRIGLHTPNLTGLSSDYILRQLRNFAAEVRGINDEYGHQMIGAARAIPGDRGLRDVAAYIHLLPAYQPPHATLPSEAVQNGAALYASCAACHASDGSGNAALQAPALNRAYSWYIARQLRNYRSGIRGTTPTDEQGALMRQAALAIPSDTAVDVLAAYIGSLSAQPR